MNGAFESTGRFVCDGYGRVASSLPDACVDSSGLFWVGMATIGVLAIVGIVVAWRVFL